MTAIFLAFLAGVLGLLAVLAINAQRRRRARDVYRARLESAIADGVLTADELEELDRLRVQNALSAAEVRVVALATYRRVLREATADQQLTPEEDIMLRKLQEQLRIDTAEVAADMGEVARLRILARVAAGTLPEVDSPLSLVRDERCHWVVRATLAERLEMPGAAPSPLHGLALLVDDVRPFSIEGERDPLRPSEEILPNDLGILVLTSRRTIFRGARRTVTIPHGRLERIVLFEDGLRLDAAATATPHYLLVEDARLTAAILLHAARLRRGGLAQEGVGRPA